MPSLFSKVSENFIWIVTDEVIVNVSKVVLVIPHIVILLVTIIKIMETVKILLT